MGKLRISPIRVILLALAGALPGPAQTPAVYDFQAPMIRLPYWTQALAKDTTDFESRPDLSYSPVDLDTLHFFKGQNTLLKVSLRLKGNQDRRFPLGVYVHRLPSAFSLYWDGRFMGRNGRIGNSAKTWKPGRLTPIITLPTDQTAPGAHELVIKTSHFGRDFPEPTVIYLGQYATLSTASDQILRFHYVYAGLFGAAMIFALTIFLGGWRSGSFLFFALFAGISLLSTLVMILYQRGTASFGFYPWMRLFINHGNLLGFLALLLFVLNHFYYAQKGRIVAVAGFGILLNKGLLALGVASPLDDMLLILLVVAGLTLNRVRSRYPGAWLFLIGVFVNVVLMVGAKIPGIYREYPSYTYFIANVLLSALAILAIAQHVKEQYRLYHEVLLRSKVLETELLRRSIQPHFIKNTLTAVKGWLLSNPQKACELVDTLSDEFEMISAMAAEKQVPLGREVAICRNHLTLMGIRKDARYHLEVTQIDMNDPIPPLVFLTLVENGLTHAFLPKEDGHFILAGQKKDGVRTYRLENDGSHLSKWEEKCVEDIEEGLGLAYVRARLEESHPGRWHLDYGFMGKRWFVEIRLETS